MGGKDESVQNKFVTYSFINYSTHPWNLIKVAFRAYIHTYIYFLLLHASKQLISYLFFLAKIKKFFWNKFLISVFSSNLMDEVLLHVTVAVVSNETVNYNC